MMDEGFSLWVRRLDIYHSLLYAVNVSSNIIFAEQEALKSQLQIQTWQHCCS